MRSFWYTNTNKIIIGLFSIILIIGYLNNSSAAPQLVLLNTINGYGGHQFFLNTQSIWFDANHQEILIADTDNNTIGIFDLRGNVRFRFGSEKKVSSPASIATDSTGNIYWSEDNTGKLKKSDYRGELLLEFQFSSITAGQNPIIPGKLFIDRKNELYFIDRGNNQVIKCDLNGKILALLNGIKPVKLPGQQLTDIVVDENGKLYVLSSLGLAVTIYDNDNKILTGFGQHGETDLNVSFPTGFAIDSIGRIWIVDSFQHRLKIYSPSGVFLFQLGVTGDNPGQFHFPIDIMFDSQGRIYVLEKRMNRIQVFELKE